GEAYGRRGCGGAFHADGGGGLGHVFELHLVRDFVFQDVQADLFAELGLGVEEEVVGTAENVHVAYDAALGGEDERVAGVAGGHLFDFVSGEVMEEAGAIAATGYDAGARG